MGIGEFLAGALSAAVTAAVAFVGLNYAGLDIPEPLKSILALLALALWNRFRPFAFLRLGR